MVNVMKVLPWVAFPHKTQRGVRDLRGGKIFTKGFFMTRFDRSALVVALFVAATSLTQPVLAAAADGCSVPEAPRVSRFKAAVVGAAVVGGTAKWGHKFAGAVVGAGAGVASAYAINTIAKGKRAEQCAEEARKGAPRSESDSATRPGNRLQHQSAQELDV